MNGGFFTWSNNRRNPTLEKLDRILMDCDWEYIYPLVNVTKIPGEMSDHNMLLISSNEVKKFPKV